MLSKSSSAILLKTIFFKVFKRPKQNPPDLLDLDFIESIPDTHAPRDNGLYEWLLTKKGSANRYRATNTMAIKLIDTYKGALHTITLFLLINS